MNHKKRKFKIRYGRILIFLSIVFIIGFIIYKILDRNLTNIYISGNNYLSDQFIIETVKLDNYPKMIKINTIKIKNELLKNNFVNDVEITKNNTEIHIKIKEAHPIYYDLSLQKVILSNGNQVDNNYMVPTLVKLMRKF